MRGAIALVDYISQPNIILRDGVKRDGERLVAYEVPVAISYGGTTQAVLMASPNDLEALGLGFTITEGIVPEISEVVGVEVLQNDLGYEVRIELCDGSQANLSQRRRFMAGPVGCGLCGIDSLEQAIRRPPSVTRSNYQIEAGEIAEGIAAMAASQMLNLKTRAVHAAAYYQKNFGLVAVSEDVGRHNAFDKLIGKCLRLPQFMKGEGAVFVSSRLSVEMIQKAAYFDVPILVAVSAPTSLALEVAHDVGLTLVAVARGEDFEVFTHSERVLF